MKHLAIIGILTGLIGVISLQVFVPEVSYTTVEASKVSFQKDDFVPPTINSPVLIFDEESSEVLYVQKGDKAQPLASVVKLLSTAVFYHDIDLLATTTMIASDLNAYGYSGEFTLGEERTSHELIFASLLASSNDAAAAMQRIDKELIIKMNEAFFSETASFVDASGLSPDNVGTVYDMLSLYQYVEEKSAHILDITSLGAYYAEVGGWLNNNPFIYDNSYRGGKHGFLPESGYTAIAIFEENLPGGSNRKIGYVVLGSEDLDKDIATLRKSVAETMRFE